MEKETALKILRERHYNALFSERTALETLIPEIKEPDEKRIRKNCIHFLELQKQHHAATFEIEECIDWLEKQGEHEPIDKVEPKFKIGDWVIINSETGLKSTLLIIDLDETHYRVVDVDGNSGCPRIEYLEKYYHLWTIEDARDGDVLVCESGWTCIFKTLVNDETFSSYCFMDATKWFCETGSECHTLKEEFVKVYNGKIYPAIKEQRDLLFSKMSEAGYEWDSVKKELKKIKQ